MNLREWALPVYTILMQLAAGAILVLWLLRGFSIPKFSPNEMDRIMRNPLMVILVTVIVAMVASHLHLSKPYLSFYAARNFRASWLSREIIFTVLFFLSMLTLWLLSRFRKGKRGLITVFGWISILFGLVMVYCMARIYMLPTQVAWNSPSVLVSFYATMFLLGSMAIACLLLLDLRFTEIQKGDDVHVRVQVIQYSMRWLVLAAFLSIAVNIGATYYQIALLGRGDAIAQTSLRLLFDLYTPLLVLRICCMVVAPFWVGIAVYRMHRAGSTPQGLMIPVYLSCLLILIGEIIGRFLFYATHIRAGI